MDQHPLKTLMLLVFMAGSIAACKKPTPVEKEIPESPPEGTRTELSLDSIFLYAKHTYVWNDALPDYQYFNPRKYKEGNTISSAFRKALFDITQFKINPFTQKPYEQTTVPGLSKYSYLDTETSSNGIIAAANGSGTVNTLLSYQISQQSAYFQLNRFAHLSELKIVLDQTFADFATSGIGILIIDLRNNNGGYVETAQYIADLMSTSAMDGKMMYSEHFNSEMQQGKANILKNQPYLDQNNLQVLINGRKATYADVDFSVAGNTFFFDKKGKLNTLQQLYFLVNGGTASASELLINSLKPYFNVKLIGEQTYGKPVGSFGIKIDKYTLYATSFLIKNSKGEGDYFDGMPVDIAADEQTLGTDPSQILANTLALVAANKLKRSGTRQSMFRPVLLEPNLIIKEKLRLLR
ncbi:MAG: S41 family peptidase [Bacteroidota bacterium]